MSRRARCAALAAAAALALAACGGNAAEPVQAPAHAKPSAQDAAKTLLAELGTGGCGCTGEARARDRLASGKAQHLQDGYTLTP